VKFPGWILVSASLHAALGGVVVAAAGWRASAAPETVIDLTGSFRTRAAVAAANTGDDAPASPMMARTAPHAAAASPQQASPVTETDPGEDGDPGAPIRDITALPELRNRDDLKGKLARYYPPGEKARGIEGVVLLEVVVSSSGRIAASRVLRSDPPGFAEAAIAVCSELVFRPAYAGTRPVAVRIRLPIRFELER
jgi:TonB family protein